MEVLLFILVILILIFFSIFKLERNSYTKEALIILKNNFDHHNFEKTKSFNELKEKLKLENSKYSKLTDRILINVKYDIDVLYKDVNRHKTSYNEFSFFKVVSKNVLYFSIKRKLSFRESVKLLILIFDAVISNEIIDIEDNNEHILKTFFRLLIEYTKNYNKETNNKSK